MASRGSRALAVGSEVEGQANILLVDDHPANLLALAAVLEPLGQRLVQVQSGEEALKALLKDDFAAILLDVQMPGLDGFETAKLIKAREKTRHVPLIFLTAIHREEAHILNGYAHGAVDYVVKPFDADILRTKVSVFVHLHEKTEALRRQEQLLRQRERSAGQAALKRVIESSPMGLAFTDEAGVLRDANDAFLRLVGYAREELERGELTWTQLSSTDASHREARRQLAEDGSTVPFELEYRRRDGSRVPVLVGSALLPEEQRTLTFVLDLTERRRADEALRQSETRYRLATLATSETIYDWEISTGHIHWNESLESVFGHKREGTQGPDIRAWEELIHPEDRARVARGLTQVISGEGTHWEDEYRLRRGDGSYARVLDRGYVAHDAVGRPVRMVGAMQDVSAARAREEQLRFLAEVSNLLNEGLDARATLERLAQRAVPSIADGCVVDLVLPAGQFKRVAAVHVEPERMRGVWELERRYPRGPEAKEPAAQVMRTGKSLWTGEVEEEHLRAFSGDELQLQLLRELDMRSFLCVPLRTRERVLGALTLVQGVSGRRFREADVHLAEDLARRAALAVDNANLYREAQEAVRSRDEFLSVASHELKTPLTPLMLKLQGLQRHVEALARDGANGHAEPAAEGSAALAERLRADLATSRSQVLKLSTLVDGLLDVTRIGAGRLRLDLEEVDLASVVREVAGRFSDQAVKARCELQLRLPEPAVGRWDRLRLDQVVTNLLSNALKYGAGSPVVLSVHVNAGEAHLRVQDAGIGIAPEHLARIFGMFERAVSERHYGGLGLGLYITQQIVLALGGRIDVTSSPNEGALFTVCLPLAGPAPEGPAPEPEAPAQG
ncbi:PAS domain S-box protein [Aggregicoccus sp. 17bor-14]|uniref:hybrid sensor histidine kinase/response regulator n=1 Tax=Myxococcaceae TaxID=31 RepID=UPI00129CE057|nr:MULTISPECIES: hybrid sensor histidine kinase/response regulator [Myxococcaceae]MBF5045281.1 PAS domain S-box protein [Simulacricoccus sp. 17bor-14]MRI91022.1 PAS domain S-box protein [Aggregicoccus sp. 17bor-14]